MKIAALFAAPVGLLCLAVLPALTAGEDAPELSCGAAGPTAVVLGTIAELESGANYRAKAAGSSASGAYQFLDSTWAGYGGYPSALLAPPEVQDAKATEHVAAILAANANAVSAVPVAWYIGHVPAAGSPEWDRMPSPGSGNRLTPRGYQQRWMAVYNRRLGGGGAAPAPVPTDLSVAPGNSGDTARADQASPLCSGGTSMEPLGGGWALPGPRAVMASSESQLDDPHHDYPAWDWSVPAGTPVYAMRGGIVAVVHTWARNWWDMGCTASGSSCDACGVGLTIADDDGVRWTYCHGSQLLVNVGQRVQAGAQVLASGDTGRSGGPHLHLQISTDGTRRCPQPLVGSLYTVGTGLDPRSLPTTGCTY